MTKHLMALVDGSAYSESVCHYAAWIAGRTGAQVKIYHVLDPRRARSERDLSGAIKLGARSNLLERLSALDAETAKLAQVQGRAILEDAKALVEKDGAVDVVTRLRTGSILDTVGDKEDSVDMILVGKRGEAATQDMEHLGSNLERLVRASHKPVFVANRAFQPVKKVMIAYDGGASAQEAVEYVARDPLFEGVEVVLATIGTDESETHAELESARDVLASGGHKAKVVIREGHPGATLGALVDEEGADLLVMGAYGHSRIRSLVIGSTTTEMIRTCLVPVLLMR